MPEALISVVMPAYNAEKYVRQAIDSILNQTYPHLELLIADDKSTDKTREIISSYTDKRIKVFHNETNKGYLKTCNKLFAQATGDYITFQDADDYSEPERLNILLNEFKKDPELKMVGSGFYRQDVSGNKTKGDESAYTYPEILNLLPGKLPFAWAVFMFSKEVYQKHGGYNEFFDRIGEEDYYWGGKIILNDKTISLADPLYCYTVNPNSVSKSNINVRKLYSAKMAKFLVLENMTKGTDSLTSGNMRPLKLFENERRMESYFWMGEKMNGFLTMLKLLFLNPAKGLFYTRIAASYLKKKSRK
ncbi:MAG TPA: glycosyltransferase family 2 protein [Bacteroidia bacterium]|jgi:glycosyltransferase involved in cell wall biosynthesis|nr:glycosyltransferase family 2 protein [Bacteroidia bacterium]